LRERRYGIAQPGRDDNGERLYTPADVSKLRAMKRLMDVGLRPGKIIGLTLPELNAMADARAPARRDDLAPSTERDVLAMLASHDVPGLQGQLATLLMRQGLQRFVLDTVTPLNRAIGDAWMRGDLQVFEEHLYTEQLQIALRAAINTFPRHTGSPACCSPRFPRSSTASAFSWWRRCSLPKARFASRSGRKRR
jgi:DNA-binding transcriptional MerR regulator